jgi:hypothetical protein
VLRFRAAGEGLRPPSDRGIVGWERASELRLPQENMPWLVAPTLIMTATEKEFDPNYAPFPFYFAGISKDNTADI